MATNRFERLFPSEEPRPELAGTKRISRTKRVRQIFSIMRRYEVTKGITPDAFRRMFEDLGPTFVKMGQLLSMRSEILPQRYRDELTKLRADVVALPYNVVLETLAAEYDRPLTEIFSDIDEEPHGSASIAQVHKGRLATGEDVAIKVIRPGVLEVMEQDISIMRQLARMANVVMKADDVIDLEGVVDELWATFQEETDFLLEARNLEDFARANEDIVYISVPHVHREFTTRSVLVMEYIDGISLTETDQLVAAGYDLEEIGEKLVENYSKQVLDDGYFHADPHPGNILIRGGQIVYIDLGMMGRLSARNRIAMGNIIRSVGKQNIPELKSALLQFAVAKDGANIDHSRFLEDLDDIVDQFATVDLDELDIGAFLTDLFNLARRNHAELPTAASIIAKGFVTLEGVLDECLPNTNIVEIITDHLSRAQSPDVLLENEVKEMTVLSREALKNSIKALGSTSEITEMLTRGQLKFNVEATGSEEPLRRLAYMVDRLTLGMIIAGLFVGSSIVYSAKIQPLIFGIPVLGFFGYLGAFILSVLVVLDIWRKTRRNR